MTSSAGLEADLRPLSEREAEVYVASTCFKTGPPGAVGIEVERILHDSADPRLPVPVPRVRRAVAEAGEPLPCGGRISFEPGGQVELSTACHPDLAALVQATRDDLDLVDRLLSEAGLSAGPLALDPYRVPCRTLDLPRYAAMQHHFDRTGSAGRTMMCSTASLQVCVEAGFDGPGPGSAGARWSFLHRLLPVLVAMFANSPFADGVPNGWASGRQAVWLAIDRRRAGAPSLEGDPREAWVRYALDAELMCLRRPDRAWDAPRGLSMRAWLRGHGPRPATLKDLDYHLTTLFPPVRPRGFLELRVVDAQAGADWEVPVAVVAALLEDERAADLAEEACARVDVLPDAMLVAARQALAHPVLAQAAAVCAEAALDGLTRLDADPQTRALVESFVDRHTCRGRCPADEHLDRWAHTGQIDMTAEEQLR